MMLDTVSNPEKDSAVIQQGRMRYWGKFSFRIRTAVILTIFILLTALAVGLAFRTVASILLNKQTNLELLEESQEFVEQLESFSGPIDPDREKTFNRHAATHELHHWFVRVFDSQRHLTWECISTPDTLPESTIQQTGMHEWQVYRYVNEPYFRSNKEEAGWVQVGCSLQLMNDSLAQLDRLLLWVFLIVGILGPIVSLFLSAQLLVPLTEMTKEAERLTLGDKIQMLGLRGSGDELDSFAGTVNSLLKQARSQLKANEDWIANSAHQLRSPLAAITSNVEVVLGRLPDGKSSEMLTSVLSECEFLNKLVHQLLLLSEANAMGVKAKREKIRWDEMIRKSSDFFEALAQTKDITLKFDRLDPVYVYANPEHIRIVLHNVLENAIKYTMDGGAIEIELTQKPNEPSVLQVIDTGIGISETDIQKVGNRFFRSNSGRDQSTTPRGTGLGLSIVKTIVEGLDGSLEIESVFGKGTTVRILLPWFERDA